MFAGRGERLSFSQRSRRTPYLAIRTCLTLPLLLIPVTFLLVNPLNSINVHFIKYSKANSLELTELFEVDHIKKDINSCWMIYEQYQASQLSRKISVSKEKCTGIYPWDVCSVTSPLGLYSPMLCGYDLILTA